jgi:CRISPR/Cas system-associated exonuclease Cas4 (RecB family)
MKLSYSKISTFLDCPRKYWYQYELGLETKKSEGFYFGSAIHSGLEAYYSGKEPMKAVKNALFGEKDRISEEAKEGVNPEELYREAERCFKIYPEEAPYFEPEKIEHYFNIPIINPETGEELNASLSGKVDLIDKRGFIVDHKSAKSSPNGFFDDKNKLQAAAYTYWYFYMFNKLPEIFVFNYVIRGNTRREPSCEYRVKKPGIDEIVKFFNTAKMVESAIKEEKLRDYSKPGFKCRFCYFKNICPFNYKN